MLARMQSSQNSRTHCWVGDTKWYGHSGKQFRQFLKMLTIHLPSIPTAEYPGQRKTYVEPKTCAQLFIAVLFTIAKKNGNNPNVDRV